MNAGAAFTLALALGIGVPTVWAQDGEPRATPAPVEAVVRNRDGEVLRNARILRFDGEIFQIEHDGGIASIAWAKMPESIRRAYPRDPTRAAEARRRVEERQRAAAARPRPVPTAAPRVLPAEAKPAPAPGKRVVEAQLHIRDLYILPTIGGPPGELRIVGVSQGEITFSRSKFGLESRELKLAFGEPRTLLFSVADCDVYHVQKFHRERYYETVQFEYAPGK